MFFSNHVLAGALVGRIVDGPAAAFTVGFASHVAMDAIPHWGTPDQAEFLRAARRDGLIALALAPAVLALAPSRRRAAVAAGMLGAGLLDLDKPQRHFFGRTSFPRWVTRGHSRIQRGRESRRALPLDVGFGVLLGLAALATLRSRARLRSGSGSNRVFRWEDG